MSKELSLHRIQSEILVNLLLNHSLRFSQLNKKKVPTDKFNFHIKKLVADKLISKGEDGCYFLTTEGKEFANRFDTQKSKLEKQAKIGVRICCLRGTRSSREYLLEQRLKQPYWGYWGFPGGKVKWGEEILEAAGRELKEETGLTGKIELVGVKHKMDFTMEGILLEDKFFFVCRVVNPLGKLRKNFEGGRNCWKKLPEIKSTKVIFDGLLGVIEMIEGKKFKFVENKYKVRGY